MNGEVGEEGGGTVSLRETKWLISNELPPPKQ